MNWIRILLCSLCAGALLLAGISPALGHEISALGGVERAPDLDKTSYSWQISYRRDLLGLEHLSWGLTYLNEGHYSSHHRDGYGPQLWARTSLLSDSVDLAAGIGPFYYFDTVPGAVPGQTSHNQHGVKALFSLSSMWRYKENDWFIQMQGNYVATGYNINTFSAMAGIGYRFGEPQPRREESPRQPGSPRSEVTLLLGQTLANSVHSQRSLAGAVEFRHRILRHLEGSASFLYEGDERLTRRDGLITQFWVADDLVAERLGVGIGGGIYFDLESYRRRRPSRLSGIVTMTTWYRLAPTWKARLSWNRIVTNYDRDTDVILAGIGYLF